MAKGFGRLASKLQTGDAQSYGLALVIGFGVVLQDGDGTLDADAKKDLVDAREALGIGTARRNPRRPAGRDSPCSRNAVC